VRIDDEPGLLARVLDIVAKFQANILTIHQSIPVNGVADITISIEVLPTTGDIQEMVEIFTNYEGMHI